MIKSYLKQIIKTTTQGDAREESYYAHLSDFLMAFAIGIGKTKTQITTLPKATEAGNPDFRVWDGDQNIVGYIEAKKPGENLDVIERSGQLKRYLKTFPNVILTDFYEFRLYRKGEIIDKTFIARASLARKGIPPPIENEEKFLALLEKFFAFSLPKVTTAAQLAKELAIRTRFLRDEVISVEMEQQQKGKGELYGFYETFRQFLIANLNEKDFADLFSQTITYGLFAARTRSTNGFNRKLAYDLIPRTIGILRNVFRFVSQGDLPKHMEVMIDDIAEVLNAADAMNILHQYFKAGKGEDPIVHFYETFLSEYDPATREKRGVYYTPEPVVRYIVRSVHQVLKTHFNLDDGLASQEVTLLDPAGGTLTFPAEAIKLAVKEYSDKYGDGGVHKLISEHILPNFYAFELMMAPYAIGHIKISFLLEELGYTMKDDERFKLYLTNTLDMEDLSQTRIPGLESLSDESHEAGKVKKNEPILVIMGNPPYSANSANYNDWTEKLLKENIDGAQSYYKVDGSSLNEHNPKLLQDDYVKFLRFAQWKIHKAGCGIVGMITNHGFLNNVTFRGMRQSLLNTFNEIYITDLHGDSQKKEKAPDGSKDENVFDITKGTAISIFIKKPGAKGCSIFHNDVFGLRQIKYNWLDNKEFIQDNYNQLSPVTPWYFFIPRQTKEIEYYNDWLSISEIFPLNSGGIKTHRDNFVIDFNRSNLEARLRQFRNLSFPKEFFQEAYNLKESSTFKIELARNKVIADQQIFEKIIKINYRPFDMRFVVFSDSLVDRTRREVMQHMTSENLAIISTRLNRQISIGYFFITDGLIDVHLLDNAQDSISVAPLYIYEIPEKKRTSIQSMMLFEPAPEYDKTGRKPNIAPKVFESLERSYGHKPSPERIMYYCYAVMYSNAYREKYAEFLKIDFPRIPFTGNSDLFTQLAGLGEELSQLHLLKSKALNKPVARYWGQGEDVIEKTVYKADTGRVYINANKYFEGIIPEMWNYHIGGYQVLEKYLKDRKGRQMSDPATYCKIATSIAETIKIQRAIDPLFEEVEKSVLEMTM
ncbi:MAG: N-6 DNA methylase [Bacteroidales bacterium]|nr:N-6 DNA methylase [Bacteroidales bacterium]